jgi:DNA-binding transcriptional LysR family regulator
MAIPFDIHQLQCFIAVAEELHFGRAAQRMHMTQPPLSRQIRLLESRLGVSLFERNGREVRLTNAGDAFLNGAREVIHSAQTSANIAREAASQASNHLSLGFTPVATYQALPRLLQGFEQAFTSAKLLLKELMTLDQLDALVRGDIDAGLLRPSISLLSFERLLVNVDHLVAALPQGHALAQKPELTLSDFHGEPFIGHDPVRARYLSDTINHGLRFAGVSPKKVASYTEPQTILAMVRAGLGLAIIPGQVGSYTCDPSITFRPLKRDSLPPIEIWMVWRKSNKNQTLQWLVENAQASAPTPGACM